MDFNSSLFGREAPQSVFTDNTTPHTNPEMSCRFQWSVQIGTDSHPPVPPPPPIQVPLSDPSNEPVFKRRSNCHGTLYHQLSCGHRIRTDLVDNCGSNCLEPFDGKTDPPFYCNACFRQECDAIWSEREAQHNACYPPMGQMATQQYQQWYDEHHQLEAQFIQDSQIYSIELQAGTRPSNPFSATKVTKEDLELAAQLDSFSLAMGSSPAPPASASDLAAQLDSLSLSTDPSYAPPASASEVASQLSSTVATGSSYVPGPPTREATTHLSSHPLTGAAEQPDFGLSALAIDRGSCGVEYSPHHQTRGSSRMRTMDEEDRWR